MKLIELLEVDKKPDINLQEAIRYIALAWKSVSPVTIRNCWKHTGIMPGDTVALESISDPADDLQTLLNTCTQYSTDSTRASDYLDVDVEVETADLPTDEDIVSLVEGVDQNDDDDDDDGNDTDQTAPPTLKQTIEAAKVMQRFFDSKADEESSWMVVRLNQKLEDMGARQKVQKTLLDFFH